MVWNVFIKGVPLATEPGNFFNNSNTNEDIATKFDWTQIVATSSTYYHVVTFLTHW